MGEKKKLQKNAIPVVRLSQCMIVKDEEENIERALKWARDIAFEQIVVDTGSTDKTVELAEKLGAKVYHFEWINDFSAAKNYAIEQASGNWIAFLDADEYFTPEDASELIVILNKIESDPNGSEYEIMLNSWVQLDDNNRPYAVYEQQRIFRNKPEIRYTRKIHEQLVFYKKMFDARNLAIMHTGYTMLTLRKKDKVTRNSKPLLELVEEYPDKHEYLIYLANELRTSSDAKDKAEAERLYRKALRSDSNISLSTRNIGYDYFIRELFVDKNRREDTLEICKEAISYFRKILTTFTILECY